MGNTFGLTQIEVRYPTRRASRQEVNTIMRQVSGEFGVLQSEAIIDAVDTGIITQSFCNLEIDSSNSNSVQNSTKHSRNSSVSTKHKRNISENSFNFMAVEAKLEAKIEEPEELKEESKEEEKVEQDPKLQTTDRTLSALMLATELPKLKPKRRRKITLFTFNSVYTNTEKHIFTRIGRANSCAPDIPSGEPKKLKKKLSKTMKIEPKPKSKRSSIFTSTFYTSKISTN